MSVTATSPISRFSALADTATTADKTATTASDKTKTLGQADFLKLLTTQFQSQDPMKPMDDTAFIAQMAQFSALQETQTLTTQMSQQLASQELATANSYIGRQVEVTVDKETTATGVVSGVQMVDGVPRIVVGEYNYAVGSVLSVAPAPVVTAGSSASSN